MGSSLGITKIAAKRCGLPLDAYLAKVTAGEKRCTACKQWKLVGEFGVDQHRGDGRAATCLACRKVRFRATYVPHPLDPGESGPDPKPPRDGDKMQARRRINVEVRTGRRPHPNKLPCTFCGHIWKRGERRHEYHHHLGYKSEHHYDVIALCTICHARDDDNKARMTRCKRGHEFSPENTIRTLIGHRICRACKAMRNRERRIRPPGYWRTINAKRRGRNG